MEVEGGDTSRADGTRRDWRTTLVVVLAALALVHSLLVALWLAPQGPVREAAGGSTLSSYVDPYFRQSWDLLDPSAQRVDETLWVRARVRRGDDRLVTTPWLDVTKVDLARARDDVAPARVRLAGRRLATNLNDALFGLGDAGRREVLGSYVQRPVTELRSALLSSGAPAADVAVYLDLDTMTTRFASLYTQAFTEGRVVQVQYRVGRRTVPPHEERGTTSRVSTVPFEWFDAGWRRAVRGSEAARAAFDSWLADV
jgi:hypothetical protein